MTDASGALLFARYAYPPNALGLCGADEPRTLLEYGAAGAGDGGLAALARTFEGAWPYLELIAAANRIADPLDLRVVEAYWVGNALLDRVEPDALVRHVDERFHGRLGRARERVVDVVAGGGVPHHCFHVFAVYPWLGLLRSGAVEEPLHVLDRCRTAVARVRTVGEDELEVELRPLAWAGGSLLLGELERRRVRAFPLPRKPRPGDLVSLHWDVACDLLTPAAAHALHATTVRLLAAVDRTGATAAAVG